MFYRAFFGFLFDFLLLPFRLGSFVLSLAYLLFLAANIFVIFSVPAFYDLYVAAEPHVFASFRATSLYQDTAFLGDPLVFASLVFFNLLFANAILTTRLTRGRARFYYPTHLIPISLREYRVAILGLGYYMSCYSAQWVFYDLQVDTLLLSAARAAGVS